MAILSGFAREKLPTVPQLMDVNPAPKANTVINAAIQQSVQEFPPAINSGAFFAQIIRGPILPPYGTKDRDYALRIAYKNNYNNLVQAIVAGLTKKLITVPWTIDGDKGNLLYIEDAAGRSQTIEAVDHYTNVLNNAQFGAGWGTFLSMWLEDFFTQDFGGIMELIGPGEPTGPITGPVMGIAQLDAGRSYITGNPYYPIMYFSLISGSLHRMHADRVVRLVDSPSPDERYFRIGLCALSRTIAVANRQQFMNRYIEGLVDDKPKPGILSISNMTQPQWEKATQKYLRDMQSDTPGTFGKTLVLMGMDVEKEIKVDHMPFSDTPEKFDWVKYTELDVHALAAGFNIDVQEIWELTGRQGMGGSAQSQVLHQKSEAKMQGFLLQTIERAFNGQMLSRAEVTLQFKYNDPVQQENDATIDGQLATTAVNLVATGKITDSEFRAYLKNNSERFARALTDDAGDIEGSDMADGVGISINEEIDHTLPEPQPAMAQPAMAVPQNGKPEQPTIPRVQPKVAPPKLSRQPQPRKGRNRVAGVGHSGGVRQKEFASDAQRRAFFGNLAGGTLSGNGWNAPTMTRDQHVESHSEVQSAKQALEKAKSKLREKQDRLTEFALGRTPEGQRWNELGKIRRTAMNDEQKAEDDKLRGQIGKLEGAVKRAQSDLNKADTKLYSSRLGAANEYDKKYVGWATTRSGERVKAISLTSAAFKGDLVQLLYRDLDGQFTRSQFEDAFLDLLTDSCVKAYADGLRDGGADGTLDERDQGYVQDFLVEQIDYIDSLTDDLESGAVDIDIVRSRAQMWVNKSLRSMYELGRLKADGDGMYEFVGLDGDESCEDCQRLTGQVHSLSDWHAMKMVPRVDTDAFDCGGWRCQHSLVKSDKQEIGDW